MLNQVQRFRQKVMVESFSMKRVYISLVFAIVFTGASFSSCSSKNQVMGITSTTRQPSGTLSSTTQTSTIKYPDLNWAAPVSIDNNSFTANIWKRYLAAALTFVQL
jgi:hypothetical protein